MESIAYALAVLGFAHFAFKFREARERKKVYAVLHIQAKTEEAENMDFALNLLEDDTPGTRQQKIDAIFEITERRRKYNNDRMEAFIKEHQANLQTLKKQA